MRKKNAKITKFISVGVALLFSYLGVPEKSAVVTRFIACGIGIIIAYNMAGGNHSGGQGKNNYASFIKRLNLHYLRLRSM